MAAQDGVKETARQAKQREKAGQPRGVSREMEELIRVIAPRLSVPADEIVETNIPTSPKAKEEHQGNVDLIDNDAHLPQADFDKTDGVGAGRDLSAGEEKEKEEEVKKKQAEQAVVGGGEEKAVGGKPLPKGQERQKRDEIVKEPKQDEEGEAEKKEKKHQLTNPTIEDVPNSELSPARILVNPRCITTYAGVSHTQLALDLFGSGDDVEPSRESGGKYHFDEWLGGPQAFVCQEMRTTGGKCWVDIYLSWNHELKAALILFLPPLFQKIGRVSSKQQRRTNFHIGQTLREGWRPGDYV